MRRWPIALGSSTIVIERSASRVIQIVHLRFAAPSHERSIVIWTAEAKRKVPMDRITFIDFQRSRFEITF